MKVINLQINIFSYCIGIGIAFGKNLFYIISSCNSLKSTTPKGAYLCPTGSDLIIISHRRHKISQKHMHFLTNISIIIKSLKLFVNWKRTACLYSLSYTAWIIFNIFYKDFFCPYIFFIFIILDNKSPYST